MNCLHCHADTTNGLALCDLCRRKVTLDLEFLPIYYRNLARWKPGRAGSRPVPGSRIPVGALGSGMGEDKVIRALDEANSDLVTWALLLADDRPIGDIEQVDDAGTMVVRLCDLLGEHLTSIATTEWCGEFVRAVGKHERILRELTEQIAPGWYAGACRRRIDDEACGAPTHVVPGLTWVTCGACGSTTYARDHLETVLDEARGWVARPMRIAEAIVALVDTEQSVPRLHKRISKWGERGQLISHRALDAEGDEVGPRRYWFGEVMDRLTSEGSTRLSDGREGVRRRDPRGP